MLGGYQILDLRNIDLTLGSSASNITDAEVLKQLRALRNYIQKDYNFARPLNNQLKPVLIRFRDKKNNEKHEGAVDGLLEVLTNYYNFRINAKIDNENLTINVEFEEKTDEYENKYWDIKTAKVLLTNNQSIEGNLNVGGDASVDGDLDVGGDIEAEGDVKGDKFIGDVALESIKDAQGHNRFIEGAITVQEQTGLTVDYGKWSLSGTHLMFVVAGTVEAGNTASISLDKTSNALPQWIKDKIHVLGTGDNVTYATMYIHNNTDGSVTTKVVNLIKQGNAIMFYHELPIGNSDDDVSFRVAFDLLIDNEAQE